MKRSAAFAILTLLASSALADEQPRGSVVHSVQDIRDAIDKNWSHPPVAAPPGMRIKVRFNFNRNGEITKAETLAATGADPIILGAFVGSIIRAAREASPFSGFPKSNYDAWKVMDIAFSFP